MTVMCAFFRLSRYLEYSTQARVVYDGAFAQSFCLHFVETINQHAKHNPARVVGKLRWFQRFGWMDMVVRVMVPRSHAIGVLETVEKEIQALESKISA